MENLILSDKTEIEIQDGASLGKIAALVNRWNDVEALANKLTTENLKNVQFSSDVDIYGSYSNMSLVIPLHITPGNPMVVEFGIRKRTEEELQQEQVQTAISYLSDEQALSVKSLYKEWSGNEIGYLAGDRVQYNGKLYKCLQGHTSQSDWTPESAPSLWAEILAGQYVTEIGEWTQPGSTNPYSEGDRVTHNGKTWESLIDGNVWEPGAQGTETLWKEIIE